MNDITPTLEKVNAVEDLKAALIATMMQDVLAIQDQLELIKPLVSQLLQALPDSMDVLRAGVIDMLENINEGIKEAGGERTEFVKGQLSVFIKQCLDDAFRENSETTNQIMGLFTQHSGAAAKDLKSQYTVIADGMRSIKSEMDGVKQEINNIRFPKWLKIAIPVAFIVVVGSTAIATWQLASYKEALYANAYQSALNKVKAK